MDLKTYISISVCFLFFAACKENNKSFKKGKDGGMQYQFFKVGEGQEVQEGNILKMESVQKYNDSVLHDTRKEGPQYLKFDSTVLSKESYAIMGKVSVGDSLVFKVEADSAFKGKKPPFVRKKGGYLYTHIKILNIFRSEQEYKMEVDPEGYRREQQQQQNNFGQGNNGWGGSQGFNQGGQGFGQGQEYMPQSRGMGRMGNQEFSPEQPDRQNFEELQQQQMREYQRPITDHP